MPTPRKQLISYADTPWCHCVSRCVRRAFLCGEDRYSGESYEHRRAWVEEPVMDVATTFAIDVASFAIMSNHYHLVLHVNTDTAALWNTDDVITRWHRLFNGTYLSQRYLENPEGLFEGERQYVRELAELWRDRLTCISWFMRCINEPIAHHANAEGDCTPGGRPGTFREGRFKSQALLDGQAVLSAMA